MTIWEVVGQQELLYPAGGNANSDFFSENLSTLSCKVQQAFSCPANRNFYLYIQILEKFLHMCPRRKLRNMNNSSTNNNKILEATQMSLDKGIDK